MTYSLSQIRSQEKRMIRDQRRVILDYLGYPIKHQSRIVKELSASLLKAAEQNPELYSRAYDLIVLKKDPGKIETQVPNQMSVDRELVYQKVTEMFEAYSDEPVKKVKDEAHKLIDYSVKELTEATKKAMQEEAKKYRTIQVRVGNQKAKPVNGVMPAEFDRLVHLGQERINTLMVGPAGCGKTYIASKLAEALSLPFASQSCSQGVSESVFTGWLLPIGDNGKFHYVQSEFIRIYENGGVFLFDEIDGSDPNVLVFLNNALANDSFTLPQRYEKPLVKKHKNFHAIAAANTFGNGADAQYVGRNQLDAATLDRFRVGTVAMKYDDRVEETLIHPEVLQWGRGVRRKIEQHGLRRIMSTRVMLDASKLVENQNYSIGDIAEGYYSDWSREELVMLGEAA